MANTDREEMKRRNRGNALRLIAAGECSSRIELSRHMGLTKTAISKIVAELIERGFLAETEKQENTELGRNPIGLDIADSAPRMIGILIMRDYCEAVLCSMKLDILNHKKVYKDWNTQDELMECVYSLADQMLYGAENVKGIGVASVGPLDSIAGIIKNPPFFREIHDVPVAALLEERYHLPVYCDNDNQSAVLAEKLFGAGRDYQDILLVGIANGIGCGIITGGEKYRSHYGYTPEIGHLSIDYNGPRCVCGSRGCLELYLNSRTILRDMQTATGKFYDYRTFCEMEGQPQIDAIFEKITEAFSSALVSVSNILNPELIIIGHNGVCWPQKYLDILEDNVNSRKFSSRQVHTKVIRASFLEKTAVLGAVCNVLNHYFTGELL